jgi:serine protease inhibitor
VRTMTISLLLVLAMVVAACGPAADDAPDAGPDGGAAAPTPSASPDDGPPLTLISDLGEGEAEAVGQAVNTFGFDLLAGLTDGGDTTIISPLSVATMLAMVLAGAGGDTAEAMAEVLGLDDPRDVRVGALLEALTDTDDVTLEVANALWANEGTPFEPDYLAFVTEFFDARLEEADLGEQATADDIDAWVDDETRGLIDGIAEDLGLPNPQAVLVLLNAVYFLGEWTTQFDADRTFDVPFTLADGTEVDVPTMHMSDEDFAYAEGDGFQLLRLPYGDDGRYGMEVFLPEGDLPSMLADLDEATWAAAVADLQEQEMDVVALPTFELAWEANLTDTLAALGMDVLFGPGADLRPMSPTDPWLDAVVHKTFIRVDEEGTEAAAVTGGIAVTSAPIDPLVFRVDRPFAFTISDAETGTILFLGTVTDPRG